MGIKRTSLGVRVGKGQNESGKGLIVRGGRQIAGIGSERAASHNMTDSKREKGR